MNDHELTGIDAMRQSPYAGCAVAVVYVVLGFVWFIAAQLGFAVVLGLVAVALFGGVLSMDAFMAGAMPITMVITGFLGTGGMALLGLGLGKLAGWPGKEIFAARGAPIAVWIAALCGGLTVGWMPGWIAEQLMEIAPWLSFGNLEMLAKAVEGAGPLGLAGMAFAIAILAPIFEELVFRGALWAALERSLPTPVVWVITSLLFALIHMEPVHVIGVTFTGFFIGWIRWMGGSIWPCILLHFANNALGVTVMTIGFDPGSGVLFSFGMAGITLVFGLVALIGRRKAAYEEDPDTLDGLL